MFGTDPFLWRSAGVVGKTISWGESYWREVVSNAHNITRLKHAVTETKSIRVVALRGDFYPLTAAFGLREEWAAYQFHVPGEQVFTFYFRNEGCATQPSMSALLQALDPNATYSVTKFTEYLADGPASNVSGADLATMPVSLPVAGSMLLKYVRVG